MIEEISYTKKEKEEKEKLQPQQDYYYNFPITQSVREYELVDLRREGNYLRLKCKVNSNSNNDSDSKDNELTSLRIPIETIKS